MYARISPFDIVEGKKAELVQGYIDSMALLHKQPGFRHAFVLSDPNGNGCLSVTIWDTKEQIEQSEKPGDYMDHALPYISPYQQHRPNFKHWEVHVLEVDREDLLDKPASK